MLQSRKKIHALWLMKWKGINKKVYLQVSLWSYGISLTEPLLYTVKLLTETLFIYLFSLECDLLKRFILESIPGRWQFRECRIDIYYCWICCKNMSFLYPGNFQGWENILKCWQRCDGEAVTVCVSHSVNSHYHSVTGFEILQWAHIWMSILVQISHLHIRFNSRVSLRDPEKELVSKCHYQTSEAWSINYRKRWEFS